MCSSCLFLDLFADKQTNSVSALKGGVSLWYVTLKYLISLSAIYYVWFSVTCFFPKTKLKKLKILSDKLGCLVGKIHCGPEVSIIPSS